MSLRRLVSLSAAALVAAAGMSSSALADDGRVSTTLELAPTMFNPEGSRAAGMMYMPSSVKPSPDKPEGVTREPKYHAEPKYAVITLGNGAPNQFVIALDEPEDADARIFLDLNGNGDLTDDGDGAWQTKSQKEGESAQYSGTYLFDVRWKDASGKESRGKYGLNFYRSPDRDSLNYYRAAARSGKITIDGKEYEVTLLENDNDGMFNKLFDPKQPVVVGEQMTKPVWLMLDGDRYDIRGTFGFAETNFLATVSDDGSVLTMEPTARVIKIPRPVERPKMLGAGGPAPEFEAVAWAPDAPADQPAPMVSLADFKGKKVVVLDMWATWCGPCMRGLPHLSKLAEATKGQDVVFLALNVYDDKAAFEKFARGKGKQYALTWARDPAGRESDASIAKRLFNVTGIPATYVIDKQGKIVAAVSGYSEGDKQIENALAGLGIKVE